MAGSDYREPARYLLVGGASAAASNIVLIAADRAGLHYGLCSLLSFLVVTPFSYQLHARWTFGVGLSWRGFTRFIAGLLSGVLVASLILALYRGAMGFPMIVAAPLATATMLIYNFIAARWSLRGGRAKAN